MSNSIGSGFFSGRSIQGPYWCVNIRVSFVILKPLHFLLLEAPVAILRSMARNEPQALRVRRRLQVFDQRACQRQSCGSSRTGLVVSMN